MPARTNHYQKLVKIINRELASVDARLTESAMLYDSEGKCEREIDILVESLVFGCEIKIGIECTELSKPLGIRALESFKEKHRKVGINKTVVVSQSGFSRPAKEYADINHIKILTFNAARSENWSKYFSPLRDMAMYGRAYKIDTLSIGCDVEQTKDGFEFGITSKVIVNDEFVDVAKFATDIWIGSDITKTYFKELKENELSGAAEPWAEIQVVLGQNYIFEDCRGVRVKPNTMNIRMTYSSNYRALSPKQVEYDGKEYLVGGFFDKKKSEYAHFAVTENAGQLKGSMEASLNLFPKK